MSYKQMVATADVDSLMGAERDLLLKYYLTKKVYSHKRQKITYGVGIGAFYKNGDDYVLAEYEEANGITHDPEVAMSIANILRSGAVTPVTLLDILDDMEI